jgi:hypothetical protein
VEPVIKLADRTPIASGAMQLVYQHPSEPDLLIKILRVAKARERWQRKSRGLPIRRRHGLYNAWVREIGAYIAMRERSPDGECPAFMQRHYGIVDTDLGRGLLVGKVTGRDGALAPDIGRLVTRHGFTGDLRRKLADLQSRIAALNLVTTDISPRNILMGWSEAEGDHLVVVEGFGENTLIPVKSMFRFLNQRSIRQHFASTVRRLEHLDRKRLLQGPGSGGATPHTGSADSGD